MITSVPQCHVINDEMFEAYLKLKNAYVHDVESFRNFFFYLHDFVQLVRVDMDNTAVQYQLPDHYKAAAEALGEERTTIWRATKNADR